MFNLLVSYLIVIRLIQCLFLLKSETLPWLVLPTSKQHNSLVDIENTTVLRLFQISGIQNSDNNNLHSATSCAGFLFHRWGRGKSCFGWDGSWKNGMSSCCAARRSNKCSTWTCPDRQHVLEKKGYVQIMGIPKGSMGRGRLLSWISKSAFWSIGKSNLWWPQIKQARSSLHWLNFDFLYGLFIKWSL